MAQVLLKSFLAKALCEPFAWGTHDCMMFVADWARAATGQDPADGWRGTYQDEAGAREILALSGGEAAHMSARLRPLGWKPVADSLGAGDIVLGRLPRHDDPIAGVCVGSRKAAFLTARGLLVWRPDVVAAWYHPEVRAHG